MSGNRAAETIAFMVCMPAANNMQWDAFQTAMKLLLCNKEGPRCKAEPDASMQRCHCVTVRLPQSKMVAHTLQWLI